MRLEKEERKRRREALRAQLKPEVAARTVMKNKARKKKK